MQKTLELRAYELKTGNIEVELDLTPSLPKIIAYSHQMQEIFLNIILNEEEAPYNNEKECHCSFKEGFGRRTWQSLTVEASRLSR